MKRIALATILLMALAAPAWAGMLGTVSQAVGTPLSNLVVPVATVGDLRAAAAKCPEYSTGQTLSAQKIARAVFPSVVLLIMEDRNGQVLSQGSGFVIGKGLIATNFHVIEGATSGVAKFAGGKGVHEIAGLVAMDERRDLVLLSVKGVHAPSLCIGDANRMAVGDQVYAVGNPLGLEGTFSEGIISGIRHVGSDTILQITAPISPGSSGGPVIDNRGQVIGVSTATFSGGQNLNFAIPSSYLASLLARASGVRPLSAITKSTVSKSFTNELGTKSIEGVQITHVKFSRGKVGFSLRNLTNKPVKNVRLMIILYDNQNQPIDVVERTYTDVIPPRLAKRKSSFLDSGAQVMAGFAPLKLRSPNHEFRILGFTIVE